MPKEFRDVALLILVDKQGQLLLQHRTHDAPFEPDLWGFFGGGLDQNETPETAIRREIQEELGYTLANPRLILSTKYEKNGRYGTKYVFLEKYDHRQKIVLGEGQNFAWVNLSDIGKLKIIPSVLDTLNSVRHFLLTK